MIPFFSFFTYLKMKVIFSFTFAKKKNSEFNKMLLSTKYLLSVTRAILGTPVKGRGFPLCPFGGPAGHPPFNRGLAAFEQSAKPTFPFQSTQVSFHSSARALAPAAANGEIAANSAK